MQAFAYYRAIETVATSIVVTIFFAYPIFTLLLDRIVLKVHVPRSTVIAIAAIFIGVAMTSLPQMQGGAIGTEGLLLAASTPILYAIYITFSYGLTSKVPAFVAGALIYLGQLSVFGALGAFAGLSSPSDLKEWALVFAIGTFGGALQIASFAYALPRLSGSGYAVIVSLELVTVVLVGVIVIGEKLEPVQVAGVCLVVAGVLLDRLMRAWTRRTTPIRR
ncbi:MAG: DMT family transporter, partial [Hyphomicrobiaceae bacterium]